ncbi:nuclear receptor corepressor 1-like isoform X8 [Biomphalaria pfeifferi]|uniref:Nuclear receptor corepressor 1-like isoform X8 n=1 Tax=Biomphalaria pfeifferi TaxID=112525 RepID=A0AAD8FBX0_BIOPF|nr:nuclear receptor corepressor 1-like isoform X8 [Biomphalaria pfeifferi]
MSNRPPNERGLPGPPHDPNSPYKRSGRPPSPSHTVSRPPGHYYPTPAQSHNQAAIYLFHHPTILEIIDTIERR